MAQDLADFQRAVAADRETVLHFLRDIPPAAEPVHDYITDLDERCALFSELQLLHQDLSIAMPNAATMGFFMIAPTVKIREHLSIVRNTELAHRAELLQDIDLRAWVALSSCMFRPLSITPSDLMLPYLDIQSTRASVTLQLAPLSPPTAMLGNQGDVARSKAAARHVRATDIVYDPSRLGILIRVQKAKDRDGNVCLVSGMSDPEAAHIFPFAASQSKRFGYLDALLQCFWGIEQALTWRNLYTNAAITQSVVNHLCLSHQLHFWFDKARFAFKPLFQTDTTITLQFHWLRRTYLSSNAIVDTSVETLLDSVGLRTFPATWGSCLAHRASGVPVRTGQTFVVQAKYPGALPSFELLELQWNLLRVAAICGAADVDDDSDSEAADDGEPQPVPTAGQIEAASPPQLPITEQTLPDRAAGAGETRST